MTPVEAYALASEPLHELTAAARARRDAAWGGVVTYSPKVFLPLTNLCRNACDYCSFRRSPGQAGEWTMRPDQVIAALDQARDLGCSEALLCLGDEPEAVFSSYRDTLGAWGHDSTVDYLVWAGERALERGLLPHTNAGVLDADAMGRLKEVNVSLGLMLESVSDRLCERGMPHHRAPDKRPARRLAMHDEAGQLRIPFTSGVLIGIGETLEERVDTLLAIGANHAEHGHIQEVIVQRFTARPDIRMARAPQLDDDDVARIVALARLLLPDDISVQAPPNLGPHGAASNRSLLRAGVNDLGGISPLTPDYINPSHPWPHLEGLAALCRSEGLTLAPRLPVYDRYVDRPGFLTPRMRAAVRAWAPVEGARGVG